MSAEPTAVAPGTAPGSLGRSRPRYGEQLIKGLLFAAAALSVVTTAAIVISLIPPTVGFFERVGFGEFFFGDRWTALFQNPQYGVLPLVTATLVITAIALLVAVPVGLLTAIYLSEYAHARVRKIVKPVLEVLAGIPTVVFGFFALKAVTPWLQDYLPFKVETFNAFSAGVIVGVMIIPTVASLAEDAMSAVPHALRDGAFALGSSRMIVSLRVVFPAALSGIVAAIVLAISRAIGETMIVVIASGLRDNFTLNPFEAAMTMTGYIASAGSGDLPTASFEYRTIFAVGALLFVITLIMNLLSIRLVRKFREVYE
ncbi:MAG: phosphate ABC transporter permease subunit PstC [Sporichthyaceae bacterium]|nr:phosphate ABC transporter permease subunit PstC [Sporichthyaceae bacterium]